MATKVLDQIITELRTIVGTTYPQRGELGNIRLLGHIPKKDYVAYDLCADFSDGVERFVAKVYRPDRIAMAQVETANLQYVHRTISSKKLNGIPCLLGNFADRCAVVTTKISGLPLQPIIMKAALLSDDGNDGSLALVASRTGKWLRAFQKATADFPQPFDAEGFMSGLVKLCDSCRLQGLDPTSIKLILEKAQSVLSVRDKVFPGSAVLTNFAPLNVIVTADGVGFSDFSKMKQRGNSFEDVAMFMASAECLEKYPFCARKIIGQIQGSFLKAYELDAAEMDTVHVLKMKILLEMLVQGRTRKTNTVRKNAMWSNVMSRFVHQSVHRQLTPLTA
jgi:hypothetical protein